MSLILSGDNGVSDIDGSASTPAIRGTDPNTGIFFPAADTIAFAEGGAEAMRIDSSGRMLVGNTSSNAAFGSAIQVQGNNVGSTLLLNRFDADTGGPVLYLAKSRSGTVGTNTIVNNGDDIGSIIFNGANGTGYSSAALISASVDGTPGASADMPGRLVFSTTADGSSTPTERMRIDSSGRVLIGTTSSLSDNNALQVVVDNNNPISVFRGVSSAFGPLMLFNKSRGSTASPSVVSSGDELGGVVFKGYDGSAYRDSAAVSGYVDATPGSSDMPGRLVFFTVPDGSTTLTERARITSGGNFLMGTTGISSDNVSGFASIAYTGGRYIEIGHNTSANTGESYAVFRYNGTLIGQISQNGTTGVTYATSSDYRLKENIAPMTGALEKVTQLKPVTYTWKADGSAGQGFIAHELQAVVPDCVIGEKDATEIQKVEVSPAIPATYDEDGNELTPAVEAVYEEREVAVYQGVDTSFLVATLTAAIQELKAELDATKAEVAAMKGQA